MIVLDNISTSHVCQWCVHINTLTRDGQCARLDRMKSQAETRGRHPIGVAAERTGLSQEVLRVWERRYGVVEPSRAGGGQRLYSDADLERLLLLRRATQGGRAIGQVATLSIEELSQLVRADDDARAERGSAAMEREGDRELDLEEAIGYARKLDSERLELLLKRTAAIMGAPRFLERAAAPFLRKVGDEWHGGRLSTAQEHLATAVVQRVVISILGSLSQREGAPTFLVGGPSGERHEMGGLLAAAVAASEGWRVVYLGTDLPAPEIAEAARASGARAVGLSVVFVEDRERTVAELSTVRELLPPSVPLLIGGGGARVLEEELADPGTRFVADLEDLRQSLRAHNPRGPTGT